MIQYAYLIPVFPLIAFTINILLGRYVREKAAWISVATSLLACVFAFPAIAAVIRHGGHAIEASLPWLSIGSYSLEFGYLLDPLSATLLFVVTVVGTLIQIYSIGYMHGDPRFSRFFAYVSLFMAAMLTLVIANNYVLFFMAWEVMGLCSYLLIGFWFEKDSAANAGNKAFFTTRVGDVGFFLGIFSLFVAAGTLNFSNLETVVAARHQAPLLPIAALLIFCGTIGKSAQFPLHVWLPDAMEGPTPVSALIHAATMVAAGVYLVARSFALFALFPEQVMTVVVAIGTITAFMAAFIALTATDIKKVLAYSTISQLGYMVTALGLGGLSAGTFHLMTHAFFKALLFLGAGSVIHGTGTQDLREMGGLLKKMKHTGWTFLIASLAISGVPPLSGFWSKDEILLKAYESPYPLVYWALVIAAFMTAFYMFRLVFLAFFGEPRKHDIHAHESPAVMTVPLWVLAVGSVVLGIPGSPWMHHWFQGFIHGAHHGGAEPINAGVMATSIAAGLGGIALAWWMYLRSPGAAEAAGKLFRPLYQASFHKLWFDELYSYCIVRPWHAAGRFFYRFDQTLIDGAVNGAGYVTIWLGNIKRWIDTYLVDGLVNFVGYFTQFLSAAMRRIQTGMVQHYLLFAFLSVLVLMYIELRK